MCPPHDGHPLSISKAYKAQQKEAEGGGHGLCFDMSHLRGVGMPPTFVGNKAALLQRAQV